MRRRLAVVVAGAARACCCADFCGFDVAFRRIDEVAFCVFVVVANPGHRVRQAGFVAALGRVVKEVIRADKHIQAARVA